MSFNPGDRVRVIGRGWKGTVKDTDEYGVLLLMDEYVDGYFEEQPDRIVKTKEGYVHESELELMDKDTPEWEDIWETAIEKNKK
jgi:hypothetical protein